MSWKSIAMELDVSTNSVRHHAQGRNQIVITFERGVGILRLFAAFHPERFEREILPMILGMSRTISPDDAIRQLLNSAP